LLELGDPNGEVAIAYRIKERLRDFYATDDPEEARTMLEELQRHCVKRAMPPEIQRLGRTIRQWFDKICNFHIARVRTHRVAQQPDQTHQTDRLRLPQFQELPDPGPALRRQTELASPRLDRRPMRAIRPRQDPKSPFEQLFLWRPRQDSNLRHRLRRPVLYPLSYGGKSRRRS
jgi:hypothetical protein